MATQTPNHKLTKPEMTDKADISMINPNWDTLDTALKAVEDRVENTETSISLLDEGGKVEPLYLNANESTRFNIPPNSSWLFVFSVNNDGSSSMVHVARFGSTGLIYTAIIQHSGLTIQTNGSRSAIFFTSTYAARGFFIKML